MRLRKEQVHRLFQIGVVMKGIDGILEVAGGLALLLTTKASILDWARWMTRGELQEDPHDFVATHLLDFFRHLTSSTQHFASVYLLIHGLVKIGLVVGLWRGKHRAYPAALVVLGLFLGYQLYRLTQHPSLGLAFVSTLDLIILGLIWKDYTYLKPARVAVHASERRS